MRLATWNVNSLGARLPASSSSGWRQTSPTSCACRRPSWPTMPSRPPPSPTSATSRPTTGTGGGTAWPSSAGSASMDPGAASAPTRTTRAPGSWPRRASGVRVHSVYVPNGRSLDSEHYAGSSWPGWPGSGRYLGETVRPGRRGGGVRRLQRRPRRRRRVGPGPVRRGDPRQRAGAGGARRRPRLGARGRLSPVPPRRRGLQLVGLPGRRLPQGPRHADRPGAAHPVVGRPRARRSRSTARPARRARPGTSPPTTPSSSSRSTSADA